jgi:Lon protease-like protein
MEEIGLFPLDTVLLPGERVPLHIFEERYKELIGACLAADGEFGLVLSDEDGIRTVGTRSRVDVVLERFDDGRMNIVVRGGLRFAIDAITDGGDSFDTARIHDYADEAGAEQPRGAEAKRCLETFRRLAATAKMPVEEPEAPEDGLAFDLAGRIAFGPSPKQELLELRTERARVRRLIELMEAAEEALVRRATIRERAAGNGHVEAG